jgi:hypothetical protein
MTKILAKSRRTVVLHFRYQTRWSAALLFFLLSDGGLVHLPPLFAGFNFDIGSLDAHQGYFVPISDARNRDIEQAGRVSKVLIWTLALSFTSFTGRQTAT